MRSRLLVLRSKGRATRPGPSRFGASAWHQAHATNAQRHHARGNRAELDGKVIVVPRRYIYAEAGVRELRIVEPSGSVECWHGDGLSEREVVTDRLRSALLPGFDLNLADLSV